MPVDRKLVTYLLLPRPMDLGLKAAFLPASWLLVHWSRNDGHWGSTWSVVVAVVAFEVFIYQARYMVNDLLDRRFDQVHPASTGRRRLPGSTSNTGLVLAMAAIRLVLGFVLLRVLNPEDRAVLYVGAVASLLLATMYELARQHVRRHPQEVASLGMFELRHGAVIALVGGGYAVRVVTGAALAQAKSQLEIVGGLFAWAFGVMFVSMGWVIEATTFNMLGAETWNQLRWKSHLAALFAQAPGPIEGQGPLGPSTSWRAVWQPAFVLSGVLAGVFGAELAHPETGWIWAGLVGGLSAFAIASGAITRVRAGLVSLVAIALLGLIARPLPVVRLPLALIPLVATVATYVVIRSMSPASMGLYRPGKTGGEEATNRSF